jgi:hypothetical protein
VRSLLHAGLLITVLEPSVSTTEGVVNVTLGRTYASLRSSGPARFVWRDAYPRLEYEAEPVPVSALQERCHCNGINVPRSTVWKRSLPGPRRVAPRPLPPPPLSQGRRLGQQTLGWGRRWRCGGRERTRRHWRRPTQWTAGGTLPPTAKVWVACGSRVAGRVREQACATTRRRPWRMGSSCAAGFDRYWRSLGRQ